MRGLPLFRRALADSWRSLIGWSLGILAALALYLPLFPSIAGSNQLGEVLKTLPEELVETLGYQDIATGAGYTQATFFGLIGFLLVTIAGVAWGSAAIAGAEESGSLELTLAHAVSRVRLVLERTVAILVRLVWLSALGVATVLVLNEPAQLHIEPENALAGGAALAGLTLLSAATALAAGAITGRRAVALGAGAGIAILGYAFNAIAKQSEQLEWLHALSPYHWAYGTEPLSNGWDWGGLALLYGLSALLVAVAAFALNARDVAV